MTRQAAARFDAGTVKLDGKHLVEASAGTGKTYAITTLFVRLLLERALDPSQILVVTFTEAATAELRDRVRQRLVDAEAALRAARAGETPADPALHALAERRAATLDADLDRLRVAIENVDEAVIATIHGFCHRMLHESAFGTRTLFDAELVPDLDDLRDDFIYDFWHSRIAVAPRQVSELLGGLGIDLERLRRLVEDLRRNPRLRVEPAQDAASDEAIAAALEELRTHAGFELEAYLKANTYCGKIAAKANREALDAAVARILSGASAIPPTRAECIFPAAIREHWKSPKKSPNPCNPHPFFTAWEHFVQLSWGRAIALQRDLLESAPAELARRKDRRGVLGFEDVLDRLARAVTGPGGEALAAAMRRRFGAVLIDEFQDTDPVQLEIFDTVFGRGRFPLFLIGDPKQSIYGFRGADVFTYLRAGRGAERHTMPVSWRSDPGLIDAVNRIFRQPGAFKLAAIDYDGVEPRPGAERAFVAPHASGSAGLELLFVERPDDSSALTKVKSRRDAARIVAADIVRLLGEGAAITQDGETRPVTPADIAVLTRKNDHCELVQEALAERGVHSVVLGDQNVFDSEEAQDVLHLLGGVLDPTSNFELKRALATRLVGQVGSDLAALEEDPVKWNQWAERFRIWNQLWVQHGFIRMFRAVLAETEAASTLLSAPDGERTLTNVLHIGELLHRAATEEHLGPAALIQWLRTERTNEGAAKAEHAEIRLESDEAAVRILTTHKSKGLEFPVVYCPFLWDGVSTEPQKREPVVYHDDTGQAVLDIDADPERRKGARARREHESLAEEVRVAYVALTRARHRCTVLWGGFNGLDKTAAMDLLHPEPSTIAKRNAATDAELLEDLEALARDCPGDIAIRRVPLSYDAEPRPPETHSERPLAARHVPEDRRVHLWTRTDSFSGLVRHRLEPDEVARDHDEDVAGAEQAADLLPAGPALSPATPSAAKPESSRTRIVLDGFPRGRRTGDFFHVLFENIDFAAESDDAIARTASDKLEAFGFTRRADPATLEAWRDQVVRAVRDTLATPLGAESGLRLGAVPASRRFNELEFHLPVPGRLDRDKLAAAFSDHPSDALPPTYAAQVARLGFRPLMGFVRGFIDLVFEHGGRWYVVDYKTNHLGDFVDEYARAQMTRAMEHAHYFLQYHLYALAVHRYLRQWQPGYDYATHFGGVLYLFIKGMRPEGEARTGVFFEKPPAARLDALSAALGKEAAWS